MTELTEQQKNIIIKALSFLYLNIDSEVSDMLGIYEDEVKVVRDSLSQTWGIEV
jgi:hypothetical protein